MVATYEFTLTSKSALLMHHDNIKGADRLSEWRKSPANKNISTPGDDRSPAWTWTTYLYTSEGRVVIPSEAIMGALKGAGKQVTLKGMKTFKSLTQSGILLSDESFPLLVDGGEVPTKPIVDMESSNEFEKHEKLAEKLGFSLFVNRAKIGTSKHIRVRPRFDKWALKGMLQTTDPAITEAVLEELFKIAGDQVGIGDWRPSSGSPGPYGRFSADVARVA